MDTNIYNRILYSYLFAGETCSIFFIEKDFCRHECLVGGALERRERERESMMENSGRAEIIFFFFLFIEIQRNG